MNNFKFFGSIILTALFLLTERVEAKSEDVTITPLIIDQETSQRDIIKKDVRIKNNSAQQIRLYASVHALDQNDFGKILDFVDPSLTDRTENVTSWIEISRARIVVPPQSEVAVPLTIRVSPQAKNGEYRAFVGFASGENYDAANKKVTEGQGDGVTVRLEIGKKAQSSLKLLSFSAKQLITGDKKGDFKIILENPGDTTLFPTGEVIIYDSDGREHSSVKIDSFIDSLLPQQKKEITVPVPKLDNFGKNKAFLSLEYGTDQKAMVYDTDFFYYIPQVYLIILLVTLIFLPLLLTLLLRRLSKQTNYDETVGDIPVFLKKTTDYIAKNDDIDLKK